MTASAFRGPPLPLTAWLRLRSSSSASAAALSSIPADGTRIAEVSTSEFDDMHVAPGDTVGYAVLSKRGPVESVAAISLGPFLFLADVKDVRVEFRNREVELGWSLPRGVSEVRVIRKQGGPPKTLATATAFRRPWTTRSIATSTPTRFITTEFTPSMRWLTESSSPRPALWSRRGRSHRSRRSRLRGFWWNPAAAFASTGSSRRGVRSRFCARPARLPHPVGTRLSVRQTDSLEGRWIDAVAPDRAIDAEPPSEGHCYYTPLAVWGDTATVGHSVALSRVADPTELRATRSGNGLGIARRSAFGSPCDGTGRQSPTPPSSLPGRGRLPQGPDDPAAITATVFRGDYDRQECWTLNLPITYRSAATVESPLPSPRRRIRIASAGERPLAHQGLQRRRS